ncbi:MAG TPA: GNAT family protein [Bellilinea sp.]|nr:GNAT family protein [Bellilinea sp.]
MTFTTQLFQSENLVLQAYDPQKDAAAEAAFSYDPNYANVIDWAIVPHPLTVFEVKKMREDQLKKGSEKDNFFLFGIHSNADGQFLGIITFPEVFWFNRYSFFKVYLGEPIMRQALYAEALNLALVYGLEELDLYSLYTSTGEYEPEVKLALEGAGFQEAVRQRENIFRDGRYWDRVFVELMQSEWKIRHAEVHS